MKTSLNIKIGGKAGEGIKTTGLILSKIFTRSGFQIFSYDEYPSLIRGGHNTYQMYADSKEVFSQHQKLDILIALDKESVSLHQGELSEKSFILYDPDEFKISQTVGSPLPIPWARMATESGGSPIMANMVSLGAVCGLTGLSLEPFFSLIEEAFGKKGEEVVSANKKAAQVGFDFIKQQASRSNLAGPTLTLQEQKKTILTGNEAIGLGAIAGGLKYFTSYPMTPISNLLHFLAEKAEKYSLVVNHTENEIAAINTAIGAGFAGARSMTATSGGGFSLMVEALGLAGATETPLVVVEGMRPGPSTGMPTWTGQADLLFMISAGQDEFPRMTITPGTIDECISLTQQAFYLAEKYQIPVIILADKYLLESHKSCQLPPALYKNKRLSFCENLEQNYQRYQLSETGISPRPFLGQKGFACLTNSYEHDQSGFATEEADERKKQIEKRAQKVETLRAELWQPKIFGEKNAKLSLIGWGSTLGPVLEAIKENKEINYLHLNYVWPFPKEKVEEFIKSAQKIICLEGNSTAQLAKLIAQETGIVIKDKLLKYDGRPFWPEEIINKLARFA